MAGLLAPLRLPERVVQAIESASDALQHVPPMRDEVIRIREQSEPLKEILPALEAMKEDLGGRLDSLHQVVQGLEGIETALDERVASLSQEIAALHKTVGDLQADVQRVTERLPDASAPGPLERARDIITGGD